VPDEVGVIFVKPNFAVGRQLLVPTPRALGEDPLASFLLCDYLPERRALRRRILRMRVIVVKAGAVRKDKITFYFLKTEGAIFINLE